MYVDDISIKLYRNVSSLYIMNFFCPRGQQNLVKIGQITKFQVIFVYFFNLDPFLPFSIPLEYFLNPYSESLYCFLKRTLQTTIHIGNSHIQQVPLAQSTACFQFKYIITFKIMAQKIEIIKVKTSNSICIIMQDTAICNRYLWRSQQLVFNLNPLLLSK